MQSFQSHTRARILAAGILVLVVGFVPSLWAQATPLSVSDAVTMALENDPGVQSSSWDWLTASAKADAAKWHLLPAVSLGAGYQKLSDLPAESLTMANPFYPLGPTQINFAFPASLTDYWALTANVQYTVFAGFRVREALALAQLQADSKLVGIEMVKRALIFEVRRAYWEAARATFNRQTLEKNLELMKAGRELTSRQVGQGTATRADQLAADARLNQADLDLGDAVSLQNRAYLTLASLIGKDAAGQSLDAQPSDAQQPFALSSQPKDPVVGDLGSTLEENDLVSKALARRPETRLSSLSLQMGEHAVKQAQGTLYPTVTLTGNYTYADPNQRVPFQTDSTVFTGTWALGVQIGYDLGGLASNISEIDAQGQALKKTEADAQKLRNSVTLDVRSCMISLERARRDLSLTQGSVDQARENLRVAQEKLANGTANDLDVLTAQFNLLKVGFAVTNRAIDVQIASADLARASAVDEVK
jgi:outer membrane protein TolC